VPWLNPFKLISALGMVDAPGPSMKSLPFGQEFQSRMHTSYTRFSLISGIEVSNAVSIMTIVGVTSAEEVYEAPIKDITHRMSNTVRIGFSIFLFLLVVSSLVLMSD
jgi:hypothetical protein